MTGKLNSSPIHVTFGASAARSLTMALRTLGRKDEILFLADDLACGPINPPEPRLRARWKADELGDDEDSALIGHVEEFWSRIVAYGGDIFAWISRRYATEHSGLLALLERTSAAVWVVDVAEVEFLGRDGTPTPDASMAFAFVRDDQIIEHALLEQAILVSPAARESALAEWEKLRGENAALRVMTSTGLVSAPINYFDETIISCVTSEWQRCSRVVGESAYRSSPARFRQGGGESFLFSRLLTLIDEGVLEGRNDQEVWSMRESWVRRHEQEEPARGAAPRS